MKKKLKDIRYFFSYLLALFFCGLIRLSPRFMVHFYAKIASGCVNLLPSAIKICCANIAIAFPDWDKKQIRATAVKSIYYVILNFLEFIWMSGIPHRINRVCVITDEVASLLKKYQEQNTRVIFVNPHLGSWEASGLMAPYFLGIKMAAIAKPSSNKYFNKLLSDRREKTGGLQIIFSRGAIKASIKALREGLSIGTLIDQNTRGRDGGEFIDFFGLPASSSTAPAVLKHYCDVNNIPAVIIYATCVREGSRIISYCRELQKPFNEYASDLEVICELMKTTEEFIRRYPQQYVWLYKRFRYIPVDASEELAARYPYYAERVGSGFYNFRFYAAEKKAKAVSGKKG